MGGFPTNQMEKQTEEGEKKRHETKNKVQLQEPDCNENAQLNK